MPAYDYVRETCASEFEKLQAMSEKLLEKCPECGKKLRRLIGRGVGVHFKDSGFPAF